MPEPLSPEAYVAAVASVDLCPMCRSDWVEADIDYEGCTHTMLIQQAHCYACDAVWNKVFELTSYDGLEQRKEDV